MNIYASDSENAFSSRIPFPFSFAKRNSFSFAFPLCVPVFRSISSPSIQCVQRQSPLPIYRTRVFKTNRLVHNVSHHYLMLPPLHGTERYKKEQYVPEALSLFDCTLETLLFYDQYELADWVKSASFSLIHEQSPLGSVPHDRLRNRCGYRYSQRVGMRYRRIVEKRPPRLPRDPNH